MSGITDLSELLRSMQPELVPGEFVFVSSTVPSVGLPARAMVVEDEGVSYVVTRADADKRQLSYDFVAAWITLRVQSSLDAVGLTAAVSAALTAAGISCNVIAGRVHDHVLVPHPRGSEALRVLSALATAPTAENAGDASSSGRRSVIDLTPWPSDFATKKAGVGCPLCEEGRADETDHGVRYFAGAVTDGYLQKEAPTAGYSVVVYRGRHVSAPHEMTVDEHGAFWSEVAVVARAIERVYRPVHLNFQLLGNQAPHVHVHIVPRRDLDPAPTMPLPAEEWSQARRLDPEELSGQLRALRAALSTG